MLQVLNKFNLFDSVKEQQQQQQRSVPKHWTARPSHFWEVVDICAKYIYTMTCTTKHQFFVYIENMPLVQVVLCIYNVWSNHVSKGTTVADNPLLSEGASIWLVPRMPVTSTNTSAIHSPIPMSKNLKVLPRKVKEFDQQIVPDGAVDLKVPSEPQKNKHITCLSTGWLLGILDNGL